MQNQFLRQHKAIFRRQLYKFRKDLSAAWHDSEFFFSALCLQHTDRIDLAVFEKRKRLAFSHYCRRQKRQDFRVKEHFQIRTFFYAEAVKINHTDTVLFQSVHQCFKNRILADIQLADSFENLLDLLLRCHICFIFTNITGENHLVKQGTYSYHKKLIQIALINCLKRKALGKWNLLVFCLFQYSFIKFQPG